MTEVLARIPDLAMQARGLTKRYGHVVAMQGADFDLARGEILAVVGDNGAGKSTLIKALSGALIPDAGEVYLEGQLIQFATPLAARLAGVETVYQELAVATQLDIAQNMFLGREKRKAGLLGAVFRQLDKRGMRRQAAEHMHTLGIRVQSIRQAVETLSGGQRQAVPVARAAAWGRKVVILDEPTAALGVRETSQVLELIRRVRDQGLSVVLISHSMPEVFTIADRIHIHRLGRRAAVVSPKTTAMSDVVAVMRRYATADEIAPTALLFASDAGSFITGSVFVVDGGYTLWSDDRLSRPGEAAEVGEATEWPRQPFSLASSTTGRRVPSLASQRSRWPSSHGSSRPARFVRKAGVVRWRRIDLKRLIAERFGVDFHPHYVGKHLKKLGFSHISALPHHPAQDERIIEAFKDVWPAPSARGLPLGSDIF